jgi:hypothetical protein
VKPDALTKELFVANHDPEADVFISWIQSRVTEREFIEKSKSDFPILSSDSIYYYKSPPFSWKELFGRAGYLVFRNGKMVKNVQTVMN